MIKVEQAILLAGGKGTRLREVSAEWGDLPKPLVPIGGKPVLEHQLEWLAGAGVRSVVILGQYQIQKIRDFVADGKRWGLKVHVEEEPEPLGTAGAVIRANTMGLLQERFWVVYGDTMLAVDAPSMVQCHDLTGAEATLFLHPNDHPADSDLVEVDLHGWIQAFHGYPHPKNARLPNLVNAALYLMERAAFSGVVPESKQLEKKDFAKDLFPEMLKRGKRLFGYRCADYIKDMGTPERYKKVQTHFEENRIRSNRTDGAVFLDRDGTINQRNGYVFRPELLKLIPGSASGIRAFNHAGLRTVLVTNQPVIARGECTPKGLQDIHNHLETLLGAEGAWLDQLYFCPHHPDKGFPREVQSLKVKCECRKPGSQMLLNAKRDMGIDFQKSWMIGDATVDVAAAQAVGVKSILLRTGEAGNDWKCVVQPDFECMDLLDASDLILGRFERWARSVDSIDVRPGQSIAIGGLARSGKSELASVWKSVLRERGIVAHVVSLDGWLKPFNKRGAEGAPWQDRYDADALVQSLDLVLGRNGRNQSVGLSIPLYDRQSRQARSDQLTRTIGKDDVVLFEGVVALEIPVLRSALRVWIDVKESVRKERFLREYAWRGRSSEAEQLFVDRQMEHERVLKLRESASFFLGDRP